MIEIVHVKPDGRFSPWGGSEGTSYKYVMRFVVGREGRGGVGGPSFEECRAILEDWCQCYFKEPPMVWTGGMPTKDLNGPVMWFTGQVTGVFRYFFQVYTNEAADAAVVTLMKS